MPIYEYRCEACGRRSSALLKSFAAPDPACPHCGKQSLRRLVSTFATSRSSDSDWDGGDDFEADGDRGGDEMGDGDFAGGFDADLGGGFGGDDLDF